MTENEHQEFERSWWSNCTSTLYEEQKQLVYAKLMGIDLQSDNAGPRVDVQNKTILDMGGGPVSLLLKTKNLKYGLVVDPCDYPAWITARYTESGISQLKIGGEKLKSSVLPKNAPKTYDEVWIYNCLQHTENPQKILANCKRFSKIVRIFEWIDTGTSLGHPHELKEDKLNEWLGGVGQTKQLSESGCYGRSYFGVFKGDHYGEV